MDSIKHPQPWRVAVGKLRPEYPVRIVEILDSNGEVVLPWGAFDHLATVKEKKSLAEFITKSVNERSAHKEAIHDR